MGKEAIRYGKSAHDIIKFNYFIGIRIFQWFVIKMTILYATKNCFCKIRVLGVQPTGYRASCFKTGIIKVYLYIYDKVVLIKNNQCHVTTVAIVETLFLSSSCSFIRVDLISLLSFHL